MTALASTTAAAVASPPSTPHADAATAPGPHRAARGIAVVTTAGNAAGNAAPQRFRDRVRARVGDAEVLTFALSSERFAFDVRALDEAMEAPAIEAAPGAPDAAFVGLARVGGRSIPVFDAGAVLGVPGCDRDQLLLLRAGEARIGLLVDDVDDVAVLALSAIKPPPFESGDDLLIGVTWDGAVLTAVIDARALIGACQHRLRDGAHS